jgi:malate dehydrogenase (oxaloacetate-decarboxylating)
MPESLAIGESQDHAMSQPTASFSAIIRTREADVPGAFTGLAEAVGRAGGLLDAIDLVRVEQGHKVRDITVLAADDEHLKRIVEAIHEVDGVEVDRVSDRAFLVHLGGKLSVAPRIPLKTRDDLSLAYTPGVARVCAAIAADPTAVWNLTPKGNTVAVVTDGTAVLGLGNIGPAASLPVMEGKALLFKEFGDVDAWPIALDTVDTDTIVATCIAIAPGFGGINLEDISAPRCFEIERRLRDALDIPVFHDDQHGTAIVVLAAMINALRLLDKRMEDIRVVITGAGAAGVAVTDILLAAGVRDIVGFDRKGAIHQGRADLNEIKAAYALRTNPRGLSGAPGDALAGADVFIGLSAPGVISVEAIETMAPNAIVFALANPVPEVKPEEIVGKAAVIATGRSDYPNQINNVLAFPGVFRGALDVRARQITETMKVAAAQAIAGVIAPEELSAEYIVPSVFNREVSRAVAAAVADVAVADNVARRGPRSTVGHEQLSRA